MKTISLKNEGDMIQPGWQLLTATGKVWMFWVRTKNVVLCNCYNAPTTQYSLTCRECKHVKIPIMAHGQAFPYYNMIIPTSSRFLSLSTSSLQTNTLPSMVHGQAFTNYNMIIPTSSNDLSLSTSSLQTRCPLWYTDSLSRIIAWQSPPHRETSPYPPALSKHVTHYGQRSGFHVL